MKNLCTMYVFNEVFHLDMLIFSLTNPQNPIKETKLSEWLSDNWVPFFETALQEIIFLAFHSYKWFFFGGISLLFALFQVFYFSRFIQSGRIFLKELFHSTTFFVNFITIFLFFRQPGISIIQDQ